MNPPINNANTDVRSFGSDAVSLQHLPIGASMSGYSFASPKETDSVLLRIPTTLKTQAVTLAEIENVSANALYAAGVLYATLIYGAMPVIGHPEDVLAFIEEIDEAALRGTPVVGGFDKADWENVEWLLRDLDSVGWVKDVQVRTDVKASSTIVYTYTITKLGRAMWPRFGAAVRKHYNLPAVSKVKEEPA
jgi:hypothetical protein